jgi:hypothetical protein
MKLLAAWRHTGEFELVLRKITKVTFPYWAEFWFGHCQTDSGETNFWEVDQPFLLQRLTSTTPMRQRAKKLLTVRSTCIRIPVWVGLSEPDNPSRQCCWKMKWNWISEGQKMFLHKPQTVLIMKYYSDMKFRSEFEDPENKQQGNQWCFYRHKF